MSDRTRSLIALACGALIILYFIVNTLIRGNSRVKRFVAKAKKDGNVAVGVAVKHVFRGNAGKDGNYQSENVTYAYVVNGKKYFKKLYFQSISEIVNYPHEIKIYYSKNNPRKSYTQIDMDPAERNQMGCYTSLILAVIVVVLINNLLKLI